LLVYVQANTGWRERGDCFLYELLLFMAGKKKCAIITTVEIISVGMPILKKKIGKIGVNGKICLRIEF
jgi:hypothetical protein